MSSKKRLVKRITANASQPSTVLPFVSEIGDQTDDTQYVTSENREAIKGKGRVPIEPAKIVAKVLSFQITIGNYDRDRLIEDFSEYIKTHLGAVPYGTDGLHATSMSSYYILDGKVCRPEDYDAEKQNFRVGATPPTWAGGPEPIRNTETRFSDSATSISAADYDEKYGPAGNPQVAAAKARQAEWWKKTKEKQEKDKVAEAELKLAVKERAARKGGKVKKEVSDDDLDEIDWEVSDADNIESMEAGADKAIKESMKVIRSRKIVRRK